MRVVFAGTPDIAVPSLEAIAASGHELVAVLTRPAAPQGRSRRPVPSPVAAWGREHGLEVLTPEHPRDPELQRRLAEIAPACCPVVAYGGLLPQRVLAVPAQGWVNLHFSLLPRYRGAAPVQRALLAGEPITGATTFQIVRELDAGPVWRTLTEPVGSQDTSGELLTRLAHRGAALLVETLDAVAAGEQPVPQAAGPVSYAPKLDPDQVRIDWSSPAVEIDRLVRAANPDPGAWTLLAGERFKVLLAEPAESDLEPGRLAPGKREVLVGTGAGSLRLLQVQPLGKRPMPGPDWARGARLSDHEVFA